MAMKTVKRIGVASLGKCAGVVGLAFGLIGAIAMIVVMIASPGPAGTPGEIAFAVAMSLLVVPAVLSLDAILMALVVGFVFNATARWHGGVSVELSE